MGNDESRDSLIERLKSEHLSRRNFIRSLVVLGASIGAADVLAACSGPGQPSAAATTTPAQPTKPAGAAAATSPAAGTPAAATASVKIPGPPVGTATKKGGTIKVGMVAEPNSFDSVLAYDSESWYMAFQLYSGLMTYDYDPQVPVPDLADGMPKVSADGLEYTFKLKPGLKFSNGAPVTAQDVKFSLERCLSPEWKSWGASYLFSIVGAKDYNQGKADKVEGITAPDPQTVVFKLSKRDVTFLSALALQQNFIVPADEVKKLGKDFARKPVGTGPFMLKEYDAAGQRAVAVRNPNYIWQPLPYVESIEYSWASAEDILVLKIDKGEMDLTVRGIPAAQFGKVVDDPKYKDQLIAFDSPATRFMGFNLSKAPFNDVKVRKAIFMAIDPDKQVKLQRGTAKRVNGILPSTDWAFDKGFKGITFDPTQAKALLAEAGQSNLSFTLFTPTTGFYKTAAEGIQQDLQAIGVKVELDARPSAAVLEQVQKGEAAAWLNGWTQSVLDPHDIFANIHYSKGGSNYGKISIPEVDQLIDTAVAEMDQAKRTEAYRKVEKILIVDNAVQVPLFQPVTTYLISKRLKNFFIQPSTGMRYDRMWLEG